MPPLEHHHLTFLHTTLAVTASLLDNHLESANKYSSPRIDPHICDGVKKSNASKRFILGSTGLHACSRPRCRLRWQQCLCCCEQHKNSTPFYPAGRMQPPACGAKCRPAQRMRPNWSTCSVVPSCRSGNMRCTYKNIYISSPPPTHAPTHAVSSPASAAPPSLSLTLRSEVQSRQIRAAASSSPPSHRRRRWPAPSWTE